MGLNYKDVERLYEENKDYLFRFFVKVTQNEDLAYDIVQAVFLNLLRYVKERDVTSIQKGFLIQSGYNYFFNELEKKKSQENREIRYHETQNFQEFNVQSSWAQGESDLFSVVREEILALDVSERMKQSLILRLFSEEKVKEIAQLTGVSYRTALRDLEQGLGLLKEALVRKGISLHD